jgi:riboflavin synthase
VFTGLVTNIGDIVRVAGTAAGRVITVAVDWDDLVEGESIAVDGVCLTVTSVEPGRFAVAAVDTTLDRTTIGGWVAGGHVNLERALRAGDRLGGHFVQGHVDGVGEVAGTRWTEDAFVIEVGLWNGAEALCVPQGSIAIDGVSLTIHAVLAPRLVDVSIIDYTRVHTTLGERRTGDRVNVELDVIGKYVRQLAAPWTALSGSVR